MSRIFLACAVLGAVACTESTAPTVTGLESFAVTVTSPTNLGSPGNTVNITDLVYDVRAIDAQGATYAQDLDVDVYISYAGNKIGKFTLCGKNEDSTPLETVHLTRGVVTGHHLHLPKAYGVTALWLEENPTATSGHAVGASPQIYFANPTIPDVQTPLDLTSLTATYCSPFNGKHVIVDHATGNGKLVVSSVFINGYVVADTGANFDPKTGTGGFNHLYVFSFGRPPLAVEYGRVVTEASGNISKFVGFTELNFPLQTTASQPADKMLMPPVYSLLKTARGLDLQLLRLSGATVSLTGTLCRIDQMAKDWVKFNQFVLNMGDGVCDSLSTFAVALPGKTIGSFNPLALAVGQKITAVGMLRNFSGQNEATTPPTLCHVDTAAVDCSMANTGVAGATCTEGTCKKGPFNFWNVTPRTADDITLN